MMRRDHLTGARPRDVIWGEGKKSLYHSLMHPLGVYSDGTVPVKIHLC